MLFNVFFQTVLHRLVHEFDEDVEDLVGDAEPLEIVEGFVVHEQKQSTHAH